MSINTHLSRLIGCLRTGGGAKVLGSCSVVRTHTHTPKQQRNHVFVSVYIYLLPPEAVILRMKVVAHHCLEKKPDTAS